MRFLGLMLCAGALVACGGGGGGSDEVCQAFDDGAGAMEAYADPAPDPVNNPPIPIDFASCVPDPAPSNLLCNWIVRVKDFEDDRFLDQLADTTVKVFPSNTIADPYATCVPNTDPCPGTPPTCYVGQASGPDPNPPLPYDPEADPNAGRVEFPCMPCNTRTAVWAHKESGAIATTKPTVGYDHWVDDSGQIARVITISIATYGLIPGIVGYAPNPALGIVAGQLRDCADNGVANGSVNIIDGHTSTLPTDFCGTEAIYRVGTFYFVDEFPTKTQTVTSEDGLWAFVNVQPGPVTVFASGRRSDAGSIESNVGRIEIASFPDTITIRDILLDPP